MRRQRSVGIWILFLAVLGMGMSAKPTWAVEPIIVTAGDDLQEVIDNAPDGAILLLLSSFAGPITISRDVSIKRYGSVPVLGNIRVVNVELGEIDLHNFLDFLNALVRQAPRIEDLVVQSGSVTLTGVVVSSSSPEVSPAVTASGGTIQLRQCLVTGAIAVGFGVRLEMTDCGVWGSGTGGIDVQSGGHLVIDNCCIIDNKGFGVAVSGQAEICNSLIALTSGSAGSFADELCCDGAPESVLRSLGTGVILLDGGELCMSGTWIMNNAGPGLALGSAGFPPDLSSCRLFGQDNVIPGRNAAGIPAPFANRTSVLPDPECWPGEGEEVFEFWPPAFFADSYSATLNFSWDYRGEDFSLAATVEIPSGGPVLIASQEESDLYTDPDQPLTFASLQCIRTLTDSLVTLAREKGYEGLAEASFIAGFVQQNIKYDYVRYHTEDIRPGWFYPEWTLARRSGVCRDSALLMGYLLDAAGFDTVLIYLDPVAPQTESHVAVGVAVDGWGVSVEHEGKDYYIVEATYAYEIGDYNLTRWTIDRIVPVTVRKRAGPLTIRPIAVLECGDLNQRTLELEICNVGSLPFEGLSVCVSFADVLKDILPLLLSSCSCSPDYYIPTLGPGEIRRIELMDLPVCDSPPCGWVYVVICSDEDSRVSSGYWRVVIDSACCN